MIGSERIELVPGHELTVSVEPGLPVRVRIRGGDGDLLADIATTAERALTIAALFRRAAERADPGLVVRPFEVVK